MGLTPFVRQGRHLSRPLGSAADGELIREDRWCSSPWTDVGGTFAYHFSVSRGREKEGCERLYLGTRASHVMGCSSGLLSIIIWASSGLFFTEYPSVVICHLILTLTPSDAPSQRHDREPESHVLCILPCTLFEAHDRWRDNEGKKRRLTKGLERDLPT